MTVLIFCCLSSYWFFPTLHFFHIKKVKYREDTRHTKTKGSSNTNPPSQTNNQEYEYCGMDYQLFLHFKEKLVKDFSRWVFSTEVIYFWWDICMKQMYKVIHQSQIALSYSTKCYSLKHSCSHLVHTYNM